MGWVGFVSFFLGGFSSVIFLKKNIVYIYNIEYHRMMWALCPESDMVS